MGDDRTKPHQTAPKSTKNEILKVFRLPGEAGALNPATQNGRRDKIQMSKNGHARRTENIIRRQ